LTEEGWPSLSIVVGSKPRIIIGYSRSIDVTDILPQEYLHSVEIGKKYSPGQIPNEIKTIIQLQPFPLLDDEITKIEKSGIDTSIYLTGLYKSKKERVTVEWRVTVDGPEAVKRYADNFGFLEGSNVEKRYLLICKLYEEYKDKKLSKEYLDYINGQLAQV
jgi:hypothetical protein